MKTTAGSDLSKSRPPVAANTSRPLTESFMVSDLLRDAQRLREIVDDVARGLDADREPHQFLADAGGLELFGVHLLMRGRGRVDHQRLGVADIGEMADHAQAFDELAPGGPAALDAEGDDRAGAAR